MDPEQKLKGWKQIGPELQRSAKTAERLHRDGFLPFITERAGRMWTSVQGSCSNWIPFLEARVSSAGSVGGSASAEAQKQKKLTAVSSGSGTHNATEGLSEE